MNKSLYQFHSLKGFRFVQWSRKGYAAFCSLHRQVTIGQVGSGIADVSLAKGKKVLVPVGGWNVPAEQGGTLDKETGVFREEEEISLDQHVWWITSLMWGEASCYGKVFLNYCVIFRLVRKRRAAFVSSYGRIQMPFLFLINSYGTVRNTGKESN